MTHLRSATTTVAILGASSIVEAILGRLLEEEGYSVRRLEASEPPGFVGGPPEGVDVVLLAPGLKDGMREGFQEAMRSTPGTADIPVLPLSSALKLSLLDELAASAPWRTLFEELIGQIGAALGSAASSARALVGQSGTAEPPASPSSSPPPAGQQVGLCSL